MTTILFVLFIIVMPFVIVKTTKKMSWPMTFVAGMVNGLALVIAVHML